MSLRLNNIVIGGTVGRDPEIRATGQGTKVASFSIAVDCGKEKTEWFDITCFEKQAELAEQYIVKGSTVIVVGRLQQSTWEDKNGGGKRSKVVIIANNLQLCGGKRKEEGAGGPSVPANAMPDAEIPF
jgi:single-strand DNA-binding protein